MLRACIVIWFVAVVARCSAITEVPSLVEWEKLVDRTLSDIRSKRNVYEAEYRIYDLHGHYSRAFKDINGLNRFPTIQDNRENSVIGDIQAPVNGRYIVMLQNSVSDAVLDETVRILNDASAASYDHVVAEHIKPFRTVGKGFTATLGPVVLGLVSKHYIFCVNNYVILSYV